MRNPLAALSLIALVVGHSAQAATCGEASAKSGATTATIVELYTSEGCDSCPPADKWFSTLDYPKYSAIPLAFHVDYWDYIGWKDRFGKSEFADRQRTTVTRQGSRTVYTPQVMLDGQDIRQTSFESSLRDITSRPARAALTLNTQTVANAIEVSLNVNVPDTQERKNSALYIAVTENNLVSQVTAGENRGVTLKHDHVVRELLGPIAMRADGALDIKRSIAIPPAWKRENLHIAAFVQNQQNGAVAQAVATPLCVAGR